MGIAILEGKGTVFGTAEQGSVLASKTFSSKAAGINKQGTIAELGDLSWAPSTGVDKTVSPGYYTGGTLSTKNAYNAGFSAKTLHRVSIGSGSNGTYNATSIPNYSSLTADNFAFVVTSYSGDGHMEGSWDSVNVGYGTGIGTSGTPSISYNSSTGIVTMSGLSASSSKSQGSSQGYTANVTTSASISGTVYCFYAG